MSANEPSSAIPAEEMADIEEVARLLSRGKGFTDPRLLKCLYERSEEVRRRVREIHGVVERSSPSLSPALEFNSMDERQIDNWIAMLGTGDYALEKLDNAGEPALHRLFQVLDGTIPGPPGGDPRDAFTYRAVALGRLGARYPDTLLALVQGKTYLKLGVIQALGLTGDPRLKAIAKEALKNFGNDW
jgi:hypothetical protein